MHFTSEQQLDGDILERTFTLGQSPGTLWTPTSVAGPVPLLLIGHPGGLERMRPRVLGRARSAVAQGFAVATLELPGSGERPRIADVDQARLDLRQAMPEGAPLDGIIDRLIHPLVEQSVPEWQAAIDALGSAQKTLLASTGGHTGVPQSASEDAGRFFARHLG